MMASNDPWSDHPWSAQVDDCVGGWIVTRFPYPMSLHDHRPDGDPSNRGEVVCMFASEEMAHLIATLLNKHEGRLV